MVTTLTASVATKAASLVLVVSLERARDGPVGSGKLTVAVTVFSILAKAAPEKRAKVKATTVVSCILTVGLLLIVRLVEKRADRSGRMYVCR